MYLIYQLCNMLPPKISLVYPKALVYTRDILQASLC